MEVRSGILVAIVFFLVLSISGFGQQAREMFGKNRIQYRQFDWQYLSGENFDIYYYDKRQEVAREALQFLEGEFDRITDLIGYPPYFKTKVFLYNSLSDLRQSNVGLNHTSFNVGGETEFIKPYVEVAYIGTAQEFKEELLYQVTDLMVNEMMFGGNLKDIFQSALLMNLPDWFVEGASLYVAKGWTVEMDDFIRQFMRSKRSKKIGKLEGREAALAGQSVWNYITERYGRSSISNILNYTRVTRNEEKSILITLGVSYKQLMADWERYYSEMEQLVSSSYTVPGDSLQFIKPPNKTTRYTTVKVSPDGRYVAYAENDRGRYVVRVRMTGNDREQLILAGGSKVINQRVDYSMPLINWADDHTLGVIAVKQGEYVFWLYDLNTKSKIPRIIDRFSNVRSFDFSGNGRLAVLSADVEGQNDLYLISSLRDRVRRLTNDVYDDLDPAFIPRSNRIVFSSNRPTDSLNTKQTVPLDKLTDNYNLFVFDLDSTSNLLTRVTNTLSKDFAPLALSEDEIIYLSDQRGIVNLFKYNRSSKIYSQLTNFSTSIHDYHVNIPTNRLVFVADKKRRQHVYLQNNLNVNRQVFTPATRRKEIQQVRVLQEQRKKQEENKNLSIKDLLNARMKEAQGQGQQPDSVEQVQSSDSLSVEGVTADTTQVPQDSVVIIQDSLVVVPADTAATIIDVTRDAPQKQEEVVNTDNYVFEDEAVKETQPSETFLTRYMKSREKSRILGPFPYESKFSAENLVTSLVVDPLRGLGLLIETQMNDMLENYRFFGGIMTTIDLRNSDVFAEFQYLPYYIDLSARFDRRAIRWDQRTENGKTYHYTLHRFEVGGALPISERTRFTIKPFASIARSVTLGTEDPDINSMNERPINNYYGGVRSELVYDNSVTTGLNIIEGTRGKISFTHHQGLNNAQNSFSQVSIDVRHYQKIYREIVFAVRGFGGSFFGNSPKQYLLGGMDNWLFNKSREDGMTSEGQANPLGVDTHNQDLLFVEYATSLRGFDYATLFGNNVLLFNAELRIPIVRVLAGGPISSNFFKNLQFVGFYDIGTSWSGPIPFETENSVSYRVIRRDPFEINLKNYLNPWLYSYGAGVRTVLFGYYAKFDVAWPVENFRVAPEPRLHITLGFDF